MRTLRPLTILLAAAFLLASAAAFADTPSATQSSSNSGSGSDGNNGHHYGSGNGNSGSGSSGSGSSGSGSSGSGSSGSGSGSGDQSGSGSGDQGSQDGSGDPATDNSGADDGSSDTSDDSSTADDPAADDTSGDVVDESADFPWANPVLGKSVSVGTKRGVVRIKLAGSNQWVPLPEGGDIPNGAIVDATNGVASLVTALPGGGKQGADLWGGAVKITQTGSDGMTDLWVTGDSLGCGAKSARSRKASVSTAHRSKKPSTRLVWVKDNHGRFRSHGKNSVATVRGTEWMTRETCNGTTTLVRQGRVDVKDLRTGRKVTLVAGDKYFARSGR